MLERVSEEKEMKVAASEAWKVYGTLQLHKIIEERFTSLVSKVDIIQGDGSAGTIINIIFHPGSQGKLQSYKEKFTVVDDEKRVKIVEVVEGGYLDLGFTLYRVQFDVIDKEEKQNESVIRTTIEYELKEEAAANVTYVSIQTFIAIMEAVADHLHQKHKVHNNSNINNLD